MYIENLLSVTLMKVLKSFCYLYTNLLCTLFYRCVNIYPDCPKLCRKAFGRMTVQCTYINTFLDNILLKGTQTFTHTTKLFQIMREHPIIIALFCLLFGFMTIRHMKDILSFFVQVFQLSYML